MTTFTASAIPVCHTNGGDKGSCLKFAADADNVGLAIDTRVTNIDIVIARAAPAPTPAAVLLLPVLLKSALSPLAVLLLPVVLFKSA